MYPQWNIQRHPTPVLLPGESHGRRSPVGHGPWGREESDTTERLHFHFSLSCIGDGNGNPLQCFCLENPRDRGAWWAAIYGVAQGRTWLKQLGSSSSMCIELMMPSNHLILCHPLLLSPSIFPSIRVFSNEPVLWIRWPKYWSFSFNISPSNEQPGLISSRMDWLGLLAVQGTLKSLLQHHSSKASILLCSAFFIVQLSHPYMTTEKTIALTRWTLVVVYHFYHWVIFHCMNIPQYIYIFTYCWTLNIWLQVIIDLCLHFSWENPKSWMNGWIIW